MPIILIKHGGHFSHTLWYEAMATSSRTINAKIHLLVAYVQLRETPSGWTCDVSSLSEIDPVQVIEQVKAVLDSGGKLVDAMGEPVSLEGMGHSADEKLFAIHLSLQDRSEGRIGLSAMPNEGDDDRDGGGGSSDSVRPRRGSPAAL